MTQDNVTRAAMIDFCTRFPLVDERGKEYARYLFGLVFQAGCDHASEKIMTRHTTPVRLVTAEGKTISSYPSIEAASADTGYSYEGIKSALKRGSRTKSGHYFEYVKQGEIRRLKQYAEVG